MLGAQWSARSAQSPVECAENRGARGVLWCAVDHSGHYRVCRAHGLSKVHGVQGAHGSAWDCAGAHGIVWDYADFADYVYLSDYAGGR